VLTFTNALNGPEGSFGFDFSFPKIDGKYSDGILGKKLHAELCDNSNYWDMFR